MKQVFKSIAIAALGGSLVLAGYVGFVEEPKQVVIKQSQPQFPIINTNTATAASLDFSLAAETSVNSVVHVNVAVERKQSPWDQFFYGNNSSRQMVKGSGSGVIISDLGYIVTNNHVINEAKNIRVQLNDNRSFNAELVGADPTTDLALLKIEADDLHALPFGDSDDLRLGEWVLAVGNPFNLTSTVTAGIISAKGRNINIINSNSAIESFIQTDAVVNPGNSGGALVNTKGELIGINTAISTHTGSFEGYSFAVPANIVKKVVYDIKTYGTVQRAFLGVSIADVSPELAEKQELKINKGVYIVDAIDGGAAKSAGLKQGDIIVSIDGAEISKTSELLEQIGRKRPGDEARVGIFRGDKQKEINVQLKNRNGTNDFLTKSEEDLNGLLGAQFEKLSAQDLNKYRLRNGLRITNQGTGQLKSAGIPNGFIIVKINNKFVHEIQDVQDILAQLKPGDGVLIQGVHKTGESDYFAFGLK